MRTATLEALAWVAHVALAAAIIVGLLAADFGAAVHRIGVALIAIAPLVAAVPGLAKRRRHTREWLALLLVIYFGVAVVEVVASLGASAPAVVALAASLIEFAVLFILSRRPLPTSTRG